MNKLKILVAVSIFALQTGGSINSKVIGGEGEGRLIKRAVGDFYQDHEFTVSSNLTFISQKTSNVDFYSKTSLIGNAKISAAWYQSATSKYYVLMHAELQPKRNTYKGFLGINLFKQGRMKNVGLKCQLNDQQTLYTPISLTFPQENKYTASVAVGSEGSSWGTVGFTKNELGMVESHSVANKLYHYQFNYLGSQDTAYKTSYSEQKGAFAFTSTTVPQSVTVSMTVLFGVYSNEGSVDQPSQAGLNLELTR